LFTAKTGNVADELNEPVFQHLQISLVPSRLPLLRPPTRSLADVPQRWGDIRFAFTAA
jgi:hypothetical protein